jgi:hypothetical protein
VSLAEAGLGLAGRVSVGRLALGCDSYNHSPRGVRSGGHVRHRGGRPTLTRLHIGDLIRRLPVPAQWADRGSSQCCPEVTSIQAGAGVSAARSIPAPGRKPATMTIVAHAHPFVIGVDTHARTHTLAVLVAATGELVATEQFPTTDAGLDRAVSWAARRTGGELSSLWVIEGVASYGARLASAVNQVGFEVVEAARMDTRAHRGAGKSDPLDARRIAAAVLSLELVDNGFRRRLFPLVRGVDEYPSFAVGKIAQRLADPSPTDSQHNEIGGAGLGHSASRGLWAQGVDEISERLGAAAIAEDDLVVGLERVAGDGAGQSSRTDHSELHGHAPHNLLMLQPTLAKES